jgi:hypothetical protein
MKVLAIIGLVSALAVQSLSYSEEQAFSGQKKQYGYKQWLATDHSPTEKTYKSFCDESSAYFLSCENRLRGFVNDEGREPATDSELMYVYRLKNDKELFSGNSIKPKTRKLIVRTVIGGSTTK